MNAYWLNDDSRTFLSRGYLKEGQSAEERIREIAETAERILNKPGFADKFEDYMHRGWFSLSSPVWANFGTNKGLPISCNGSFYEDTTESILMKTAEIGMQTKYGAGTSAYIGALRHRNATISTGGVSNGPVHFVGLIETHTDIISQSSVRRGNCAVYLPVDHPDIMEYLDMREEGSPIQHVSMGVCISDAWMESMLSGDAEKRKVWLRIIRKRYESGYPYIFWSDTVNKNAPKWYRDQGHTIWASNLCSEICQPSNADWSFVCNLASMNVLHFEDWRYTDAVEVMTYFLDAVMSEYIEKTASIPLMKTVHDFAVANRAIGIGVLGYHSFLQSKMIPYESQEAREWNIMIFDAIDRDSREASRKLALEYGEPEVLKGYGQRNATRMAVAPTTSSSFILGQVSPSTELQNSNYYTKGLAKGKFTYKNPYLIEILKRYGKDTPEVWKSILIQGGSVQHLDFLTDHEKAVFKTFGEVAQIEVIQQAADRQQFIDQSQSTNLMIHPDTPPKDVSDLMIEAWRKGMKTLYYQRSTNPAQELVRELTSCQACEA